MKYTADLQKSSHTSASLENMYRLIRKNAKHVDSQSKNNSFNLDSIHTLNR